MGFIFGNPVTGTDFINREEELYQLKTEIQKRTGGNKNIPHIELSSSRRLGKSSLLMETKNQLVKLGYTPVYISLLDITTIDQFFHRFRDEIVNALPIASNTYEKIANLMTNIKFNPLRTKGTIKASGEYEINLQEILELSKDSWKEIGNKTFELLRKHKELKFAIFLDEMGFVRKIKDDETARLELLNFLDNELTHPDTPVFILCGSQNFFMILRSIKPEIYQLWRRKFLKIPLECFTDIVTINKLLIPNFLFDINSKTSFIQNVVIPGLSRMIAFVSSGYPSVAQLLGMETSMKINYHMEKAGELDIDDFKKIFIDDIIRKQILQDLQSLSTELLSEEALGENHIEYRNFLYDLYNSEIFDINSLKTKIPEYKLKDMLCDLEGLGYISLNDGKILLKYNFLKYRIWHPKKDSLTRKELESEWQKIFK